MKKYEMNPKFGILIDDNEKILMKGKFLFGYKVDYIDFYIDLFRNKE
jgi:hypothetical protein